MSFDKNLRIAAEARQLDRDGLIKKGGLDEDSTYRYWFGKSVPCLYMAIDIADTLNVSLDWLMDREIRNTAPAENTPVGEILDRVRLDLDLSKSRLSRECHVDMSSLRRLYEGEGLQMSSMLKIVNYLEISLDYLTGRGPMRGIGDL